MKRPVGGRTNGSIGGSADGRMGGTFTRRGLMLGAVQATAFTALAARLYQMQVIDGPQIATLAEDNRTRTLPLLPKRGRILDASGHVMAANRERFRVTFEAEKGAPLSSVLAILRRIAPETGLSEAEVQSMARRAAGRRAPEPITLANGLTFEQAARVGMLGPEVPGVVTVAVPERVYPSRTSREAWATAHIVGYVGAVQRRGVDDDLSMRLPDVRIGKAGVEAGMDEELRGVAGQTVSEVDARGRRVRLLKQTAPLHGRDVSLTIDTKLQVHILERLAQGGRTGAAVVLDVLSGDVVALASAPAFDPSDLSGAGSQTAWQRLLADQERPLVNRAIAGQYPPGSTFKMVTALAALKAGHISRKERIECWGDVTYAGHTFRCWNRRGHVASDLHKALRESCDCYFYEAARRTGMDAIAEMAQVLGLGRTYDAGIAQQKAGLIPTSTWKRSRSKIGWLIGETVLSGIGQGYVLATPLQLAVMTARLATGRAVTPTLIKRPPGDSAPSFAELPIDAGDLAAIRRAMTAVVNEPGGTGMAADLDDGTIVAGKTGTSQVSRRSADRDSGTVLERGERDHALFVAFVPAAQPRYAVAVVLEHAGGGGAHAAPLAKDVMEAVLEHERAQARAGAGPLTAAGRG